MAMQFHYSINLSGQMFSSSLTGLIIAAVIYAVPAVLCLISGEKSFKSGTQQGCHKEEV